MTLKRQADDDGDGPISKKSKHELSTGVAYASTTAAHQRESDQAGGSDHSIPATVPTGARKLAVPSPRRSQQAGNHTVLPACRVANNMSEMLQSVATPYPNDSRLFARAERLRQEALAREDAAFAERDRVIELHNKVYTELETLKQDHQKMFRLAENQGAALRTMKSDAAAAPSLLRKQNNVLEKKNQEVQMERDQFRDERDRLKDQMATLKEVNARDALALKDETKEKELAMRDLAAMTKMRDEALAEVARLTEIVKHRGTGAAVVVANDDTSNRDVPAGLDDSGLGSSLSSSSSTPAWMIPPPPTFQNAAHSQFGGSVPFMLHGEAPVSYPQPCFESFFSSGPPAPEWTIPQPQSVETNAQQPSIGSNGFTGEEIVPAVQPQPDPFVMSEKARGKMPALDNPQDYFAQLRSNPQNILPPEQCTFGNPSFTTTPAAVNTQSKGRGPFIEESDSDSDGGHVVQSVENEEGQKPQKPQNLQLESQGYDSDDTLFVSSQPRRQPEEEVETKTTTGGVDDGHGFTQCSITEAPYYWDVEMQGMDGVDDDIVDDDNDSWHGFSDESKHPSVFDPPAEAHLPENAQEQNPKSEFDRQLDEILSMRRPRGGRRNNRRHSRNRKETPRDEFLSHQRRELAPSAEAQGPPVRATDSAIPPVPRTAGTHTQARNRSSGSGMSAHRTPNSQPSNRRGQGGIMKRGDSHYGGVTKRGDSHYGPSQSGTRSASVDNSRQQGRGNGMGQRLYTYDSSNDEEDRGSQERGGRYDRFRGAQRLDGVDRNTSHGTAKNDSSDDERTLPTSREAILARSRLLRARALGEAEELRRRTELLNDSAAESRPNAVRFGGVEEIGKSNANNYYDTERAAAAARRRAAHDERVARREW